MLIIIGLFCILCLGLVDSKCPYLMFPNYPNSSMKTTSAENPLQTKWFKHKDLSEYIWCSKEAISNQMSEHLIVDFGYIREVRLMQLKGTTKIGYSSASLYIIGYKREKEEWRKVMSNGKEQKIIGNFDPETEAFSSFSPPIYARWIKLIPVNKNPRQICLELKIYGCDNEGNVLEYTVPDGSGRLSDTNYDGTKKDGLLNNGMGKLRFRELTTDEFNKNSKSDIFTRKDPPLGWSRAQLGDDKVTMLLRFDGQRNFTKLTLYTYVDRARYVDLPSKIELYFSKDGMDFDEQDKIVYEFNQDGRKQLSKLVLDLRHRIGTYVRAVMWFKDDWMMIESLDFTSKPSNEIFIPKKKPDYVSKIPSKISTSTTIRPITYPGSNTNNIFSPMLAYVLVLIAAILLILLAISIPVGTILIRRQKIKNKKSKEALQRHSRDENVRLFLPPHFKDCPMPTNSNGVLPPLFTVTNFQQVQQPTNTASAQITSISNSHPLPCNDSSIYTSVTGSDNDSSIIPSQPTVHPTTSSSSSTDRLMITSPSNHTISKQPIISLPPPPPPLPPQNSCPIINPLLPHHINHMNNNYPNHNNNQPILPNDFSATSFVTLNRQYNPNFYDPSHSTNTNTNSSNNYFTNVKPCYPINGSNPQLSRSQLNLKNNFDNSLHFGGHPNFDQLEPVFQPFTICAPVKVNIAGAVGNSKYQSLIPDKYTSKFDTFHDINLHNLFNFSLDKLKFISPLYSSNVGSINIAEFSIDKAPLKSFNTKENIKSHEKTTLIIDDDDDTTLCSSDDIDDKLKNVLNRCNNTNVSNTFVKNQSNSNKVDIDDENNNCDKNNAGNRKSGKSQMGQNCQKKQIVCIRSLNKDVPDRIKHQFLQEIRQISQLNHLNFPSILKINEHPHSSSSIMLITEYTELGDVYTLLHNQFSQNPNERWEKFNENGPLHLNNISSAILINWAYQVSNGMNYLHESIQSIHTDLACRNLLVEIKNQNKHAITIKISDLAICQTQFLDDYYAMTHHMIHNFNQPMKKSVSTSQIRLNSGGVEHHYNGYEEEFVKLPIRWMPWEAVLKGEFSKKSDVYAFGVLFWELLTHCLIQPLAELTNEQIIINHNLQAINDERHRNLPCIPTHKEFHDFINHCTNRNPEFRPTFREIETYLLHKTLV